MNRDIVEGAQGNPVAVAAYECYHDCIKRAKSTTNRGILFDLHGQVSDVRQLIFIRKTIKICINFLLHIWYCKE